MKLKSFFLWSLMIIGAVSCKYDDGELWNKVNDLDGRLTNIESQLTQMNTDITSMGAIVNVLEGNVYITSVTETENGYTIEFSDGKTATITNGTAGKDAPVIGFDKDTDGKYYWTQTIDGQQNWLTDENGNKIPVTGNDAVTPQLKVSTTGYWMISYDNGLTFAEVLDENGNPVKAVGEDGQDGSDGSAGTNGDSWFDNVTYDPSTGILTLIINGETIQLTVVEPTGIPTDAQAGLPPTVNDGDVTFNMPTSISALAVDPSNPKIGRFNLAGIQANGEWLELFGTGEANQNVWVEINGIQKGIKVINGEEVVTRSRAGLPVAKAKADVVFLVDNSGSMNEEANKVAEEIIRYSQKLNQNMDVKFGCVGFSERGYINGALNITDANTLSEYLNCFTGTRRTKHYGESMANPPADRNDLETKAQPYGSTGGECGGMALHYADENFTFREGSNRFYVLFTDEPNQPRSNAPWSVLTVKQDSEHYNWDASKGVIYTVWSGNPDDPSNYQNWLYSEDPTLFSNYTGGISFETTGSFNVNLDDLPLTGAITQSFIIQFNITPDLTIGGTYDVTITICYPDGTIKSKYTYKGIQFVAAA